MSMGNYLTPEVLLRGTMATNNATVGVDHSTVVPEEQPEVGVAHMTVVPENYESE